MKLLLKYSFWAIVFFSMCSRYFLKRKEDISGSQLAMGAQYFMAMDPSGVARQRAIEESSELMN
jgi:hypothetical protein